MSPASSDSSPPLSATPEVAAVIAAAAEALWCRPPAPRRSGAAEHDRGSPEYVWRLSGRWWSKPVPLRRDRPWATTVREHGQVGTGGA